MGPNAAVSHICVVPYRAIPFIFRQCAKKITIAKMTIMNMTTSRLLEHELKKK